MTVDAAFVEPALTAGDCDQWQQEALPLLPLEAALPLPATGSCDVRCFVLELRYV